MVIIESSKYVFKVDNYLKAEPIYKDTFTFIGWWNNLTNSFVPGNAKEINLFIQFLSNCSAGRNVILRKENESYFLYSVTTLYRQLTVIEESKFLAIKGKPVNQLEKFRHN